MSEPNSKPAKLSCITAAEIIELATKSGIEVYLDWAGKPAARLPKDAPDKPDEIALIHSNATTEWLAYLCYEKLSRVPGKSLIQDAQVALAGKAREHGHHPDNMGEINSSISDNPVAIVLINMLQKGDPIQGIAGSLYKKLTLRAEKMGVKDRNWPGASHILGRRIKELQPLLSKIGITASSQHTYEGTYWDINSKAAEGIDGVASRVASVSKVLPEKHLRRTDTNDTEFHAQLVEILNSGSSQQMAELTGEQIKRWVPRKETEICGLRPLRSFFRAAYQDKGKTQNILITGKSRSGKTAMVKWYVTALACAKTDRETIDPCETCEACKQAVARFGQTGLDTEFNLSQLDFVPIDCPNCNGQKLKTYLDNLYDSDKLKIVYLDEFHRFEDRGKDERLLKPTEEQKIIWIASCIKLKGIDKAVRKRFDVKLKTKKATLKELAIWGAERCVGWNITVEDPDTLVRLAQRSSGRAGMMIKVIGMAATTGRALTTELVETFRF